MTVEEYLERERLAENRSEYYCGEMFAMPGASIGHSGIVTNLIGELSHKLRQRPCVVCSSSLRLAIAANGFYTYPDVMVICGKPSFIDAHVDTVTNPVLVIEVLSESTKDYDRGEKFESYRAISSLREYLTISQQKKHVETWMRQSDNTWLLREFYDSGAIKLQSIGVELQLSEIYKKVEF